MTARRIQSLARRFLLPHLSQYDVSNGILIRRPLRHLIAGYCFESSGFDADSFYLWAFVQPLYVPSDHISFTFGRRLSHGSSDGWSLSGNDTQDMRAVWEAIRAQGTDYLACLGTPRDIAERGQMIRAAPDDPHVLEARAYSYALIGCLGQARDLALQAQDVWRRLSHGTPWAVELVQRITVFLERLSVGSSSVSQLLEEWSDGTARNLRLVRDPPSPPA